MSNLQEVYTLIESRKSEHITWNELYSSLAHIGNPAYIRHMVYDLMHDKDVLESLAGLIATKHACDCELCTTCNTIAPPNMCDCILHMYEDYMDNMRPYTQGTGERS